jgi:hypothetical protein
MVVLFEAALTWRDGIPDPLLKLHTTPPHKRQQSYVAARVLSVRRRRLQTHNVGNHVVSRAMWTTAWPTTRIISVAN